MTRLPTLARIATILAISVTSLGVTSAVASAEQPECARILKMMSGYWENASGYAGNGDWRGYNNQMKAITILSEGYSDLGC